MPRNMNFLISSSLLIITISFFMNTNVQGEDITEKYEIEIEQSINVTGTKEIKGGSITYQPFLLESIKYALYVELTIDEEPFEINLVLTNPRLSGNCTFKETPYTCSFELYDVEFEAAVGKIDGSVTYPNDKEIFLSAKKIVFVGSKLLLDKLGNTDMQETAVNALKNATEAVFVNVKEGDAVNKGVAKKFAEELAVFLKDKLPEDKN